MEEGCSPRGPHCRLIRKEKRPHPRRFRTLPHAAPATPRCVTSFCTAAEYKLDELKAYYESLGRVVDDSEEVPPPPSPRCPGPRVTIVDTAGFRLDPQVNPRRVNPPPPPAAGAARAQGLPGPRSCGQVKASRVHGRRQRCQKQGFLDLCMNYASHFSLRHSDLGAVELVWSGPLRPLFCGPFPFAPPLGLSPPKGSIQNRNPSSITLPPPRLLRRQISMPPLKGPKIAQESSAQTY